MIAPWYSIFFQSQVFCEFAFFLFWFCLSNFLFKFEVFSRAIRYAVYLGCIVDWRWKCVQLSVKPVHSLFFLKIKCDLFSPHNFVSGYSIGIWELAWAKLHKKRFMLCISTVKIFDELYRFKSLFKCFFFLLSITRIKWFDQVLGHCRFCWWLWVQF